MYWKDSRYTLKRTVAPTVRPITVTNLKLQARLGDVADEDSLLAEYIDGATEIVESDTQRALCTQTWQLQFDQFPCDLIELRKCPVASVSSISYVDVNGTNQTLAASTYTVNTSSEPGRIVLAYNQFWPVARQQENSITITFVAGYGTAESVPQWAKQAIRMLAAEWAISREAVGSVIDEHMTNYRAVIARGLWAGYR